VAQLATRNQFNLEICNDFGHQPIGLACCFADTSTVSTLSLIAGVIAVAMAGPLAGALAAAILANDVMYLNAKESGQLQQSRETMRVIRELPNDEPMPPPSILKEMGDYLFEGLSQGRRSEITAIAQESPRSALLKMLELYGYSRDEVDQQWPGAIESLQPQPVAPVSAPIAATVPITQIQPPIAYDLADDMGRNPQSSIVAGVPGAGKGMLISNALRAIKKHNPHVKIFVVDPKASPKELGYWSIADHYFKLAFANEAVEDAAEWFMARLSEFKRFQGPKLLVIDEGATVLTTLRLAKIYEYRETPNGKEQAIKVDLLGQFKAFLTHVSSMGDSEDNWMWFVSQIINCDDLGISGGQRSIFRGIGLVSPKNRKAVDNFFATGFVPLPKGGKDEVYRLMAESPCDRAYYDGKTDQWASSQPLENHSGFDRDSRTFVGATS
jgi:hypothetical protein